MENMSLLSRPQLIELLKRDPPLVEGIDNPDVQVQPNGIELTLQRVETLKTCGAVAYDNSERVLSRTSPLDFDSDGWIHLNRGAYKVVFNEIVNLPLNIAAIARPRSTLLRCGVNIETAVWDAGYSGRSESLLVVHNPVGFKVRKNARLLQLLFLCLEKPDSTGYSGIYQNENK
jgi:dUTP pyrophosphatase